MGKKPTISIRVYKGKQMSFDAKGNVLNDNQSIKYVHDTVEWQNFLKNITANGYCNVEVESAKIIEKVKEGGFFIDKVSDYENVDAIKKELEDAFKNQTEVKLTPEQQKIADLEAKLNALVSQSEKSTKKTEVKQEPVKETDLDALRKEYEDVVGKKPHHMAGEEKLRADIEAAKK